MKNLPKHSLISMGGTIEGGGWKTTDPNNPGTGNIAISVNGQTVDYDTPGGWPQAYSVRQDLEFSGIYGVQGF